MTNNNQNSWGNDNQDAWGNNQSPKQGNPWGNKNQDVWGNSQSPENENPWQSSQGNIDNPYVENVFQANYFDNTYSETFSNPDPQNEQNSGWEI